MICLNGSDALQQVRFLLPAHSKYLTTCKQDALKGISPVKRIEELESGAYRDFCDFNFILQLQDRVRSV